MEHAISDLPPSRKVSRLVLFVAAACGCIAAAALFVFLGMPRVVTRPSADVAVHLPQPRFSPPSTPTVEPAGSVVAVDSDPTPEASRTTVARPVSKPAAAPPESFGNAGTDAVPVSADEGPMPSVPVLSPQPSVRPEAVAAPVTRSEPMPDVTPSPAPIPSVTLRRAESLTPRQPISNATVVSLQSERERRLARERAQATKDAIRAVRPR